MPLSSHLRQKWRGALRHLSYLVRALALVWTAVPMWTLAWALLLVVQGVLPVAAVYLVRRLVDSLVEAFGRGVSWENIYPILTLAALMAGILLLTEVLQSISAWISAAQAKFTRDYIRALIHEKSVAVDFAFYESPEYYDRLERAREGASTRPLELLNSLGSLLQSGITLLGMAAILLTYGVWLPVVLLASTLPAFLVLLRFNRRYHQWWKQATPTRRWAQYCDYMLTDEEPAAEVRLFHLGPYFQSAYQRLRKQLRDAELRLTTAQHLAGLGAGVIGLCISGGAMIWMVRRGLQGLVTLGDLVLFYQVLNQGQHLLHALLGNVGQVYSTGLFLSNLFEFLDLEAKVVDPPQPIPAPSRLQSSICFRHVTFRYPESQRFALQDFNLTIPAGQTIAIVGANGAGKSTLAKLLCRLYDPEAGTIALDGIDLRDMSIVELRHLITILFQFPVEYHASAAENIALASLSTSDDQTGPQTSPCQMAIETAARGAGAHDVITRLPKGYETLLGKWFVDGAELSGGEWQRIALARAFFQQASIIILDEPTSFMDSWAETAWLQRFRHLTRDRTAIVITHRFTTAMCADVIHVMEAGQIIESGSHAELVAQNGHYAQSWTAQMQSGSERSGRRNASHV